MGCTLEQVGGQDREEDEEVTDRTFTYRTNLVPIGMDYEDAKDEIAQLIRDKVAPGLRAPDNDAIKQAYVLVIDALYVEWAGRTVLRERMASILHDTANALKGPPEPLTDHSWHDLPEVAACDVTEDQLRAFIAGATQANRSLPKALLADYRITRRKGGS